MASVVVQRFRECQNLMDAFIANIEAIRNITSQSVVVQEAFRRFGVSSLSSTTTTTKDISSASLPRCCTDPLGVLVAFPDSTIELIIAQHAEDVNTLLRSLGTTQQTWYNKLQQAKEAFKPPSQSNTSTISRSGSAEVDYGKNTNHMVGVHALLAVLSQMHGCLQELILALRADLAHPTRAIQLSLWLSGHTAASTQTTATVEGCIPALSLESALEKVADKVRSEWESYKAQHMVDEAWMMLVG
ncbi:hypothetical protein LSM04_002713 [Trypanosoma melophagium]|uniref:uncharacterized protein n=1 Tax=Trypanosoma melophagium TaxID=715481 RepID=UPI00351A2C49|nr:hypothetical protein LSM04_002713 [Trypanosoma melophagium]